MSEHSPPAIGQHKFSCVLCHKRKVKCDRQVPCGYCVRHGDSCVYETPPPPKRRKREHKEDATDLLARLQRAEDQLRVSGLMPSDDIPTPPQTEGSVSVTAPTPEPTGRQLAPNLVKHAPTSGRLIADRGGHSRYLDNNLWVTLDDELRNPHDMLREDCVGHENLGDEYSDSEAAANDGGTLLLGTGFISDQALYDLYPTPAQSTVLWQVYTENIHPLCMILHRPSFSKVVDSARTNLPALSRSKLALLFSTFFFAAASMSNAQCEKKLRQPRQELLKRLRSGSKYALIKAGFVRSTDIASLEAFVQFLLCMRNGYDAQTLWVLSGAAFRIAQRIGIHRDDLSSSLSPFEGEMRRRLWRQLLILDFTSSELAGSAPGYSVMLGLDANSRIPLNVNDEDLDPDMVELPPERVGAADMLFCRLRYEFGAFFLYLHRLNGSTFDASWQVLNNKDASLVDKDRHIDELENNLQSNYLKYCDPINPLHNLTTIAARAAVCGMRLRAHHPRQYADGGKSLPQAEKDLLFQLSTKVMQYDVHCHSHKGLQGYLWHVRVYFQWHALIYLLSELRSRRFGDEVDKTWQLIDEVFQYHPEIMMGRDFALYLAIRSIALRAWDAREAELRRLDIPYQIPETMTQLRAKAHPRDARDGLAIGISQQYQDPSTLSMSIESENAAKNEPALPYNVTWPQAMDNLGNGNLPEGIIEFPKPGEPSPIDWDAWDSLVQSMDLPALEFGLDAFFK